ncbi:MAG: dimethylamine monooxygenase subunit DmmA family protein [Hyphomicrobium sp.]|nr:dimethylamine monooxygenase subunit DmmA family protein [Hyphomicrobium sp.]
MLRPGMPSRPVYKGLVPDIHARQNIVAAEGEGARAVLELAETTPAGFFDRTILIYVPTGSAGQGLEEKLKQLNPQGLWIFPTLATAMFRLKGTLATATMGTRLYATGTEPFIASVIQEAQAVGIDQKSVIQEHRGSAKRRVQCVHCKGMTDDVTTSIVRCAHCGLNLFVRDHFSRRLGAFQGVCVDAEVPGDVPAAETIYE